MRRWTIKGEGAGWRWLAAGLLATIVVACGGGGGGGMSSPSSTATGPAGVSVGAITGFGSVHVNGKKFQTTSTVIHVDGQPGTQADLHVGDVIEVKGHHDSNSNTDVADAIELHSNVVGPAGTIDLVAQHVSVLGQTVIVSAATSFGDGITPASIAGLATGDILRVSGNSTATGEIQATRIERKPAGTLFRVSGTSAATDPVGKTLMINALTVDFSTATLSDFPSGGPMDGQLIEAVGATLGAAGELKATRLELRSGKELKGEVDSESEVEGLVTRFASTTDFDVAGRAVTTDSNTQFRGGAAADLALDLAVEVEGTLNTAGVLVAKRVTFEKAADASLLAQVDAINAGAGTVTALGTTISVNALTRFEDHGSNHVNTFSLADVHTGDWIQVRGSETPVASGALLAARFERVESKSAVRLSGFVRVATAPMLTILSTSVATTGTTSFTDSGGHPSNASAFFGALPGKVVSVTGSWDGATLTANGASLASSDSD
jgi:hypothetical protein